MRTSDEKYFVRIVRPEHSDAFEVTLSEEPTVRAGVVAVKKKQLMKDKDKHLIVVNQGHL